MTKDKEYKIPEELEKLQHEQTVYEKLRDLYVYVPFGFRLAKKCAQKAVEKRIQFWDGVFDLYPELKGKALEFFPNSHRLKVLGDDHG